MPVRMAPNMVTYIKSSIISGLSPFYVIGGTILVCMAAFWGFGKIKNLLTPQSEWQQRGYSSESEFRNESGYYKEDSQERYVSDYAAYRYERRFGGK